ncbi:MAG: hypothetical protein ACO3JV_11845 [Pseudomonadales bacterium]
MSDSSDTAGDRFRDKLSGYGALDDSRAWFERNWQRVRALFSEATIRDFVFEPIRGVFSAEGSDDAKVIRQTITVVAVANAIMAGLPGKMGVGVAVSIALEAWMAYVIAARVGVEIKQPSDIWKYFGLLAAVAGTVLYGIRTMLGLAFSITSIIPGLNPMILAELAVTNLVGVLFWIGFEEAKRTGSFTVPMRALSRVGTETKNLVVHQWDVIRDNLNPTTLSRMRKRLTAWLKGEIPVDYGVLRGQVVPAVLMAQLLSGNTEHLDGPVGREFVAAIRDRFPELREANIDEIADHIRDYDPEQMNGVLNLVKGKLFERLVTKYENADGDGWRAVMHEDESHPGADIVLTNEETGQVVELSLKATDNPAYIETALLRYPDIPVLTTEEVSRFFGDDPQVTGATITHADLAQVTRENFDELLSRGTALDAAAGAASGVAFGTAIGLWPFVAAYIAGRIDQEHLERAFAKALGDAGIALAARISYALVLGPVFAWYLLARGVIGLTRSAQDTSGVESQRRSVARLEWVGARAAVPELRKGGAR